MTRDIVKAGAGLGAADEGGGRRDRHRAVAFRHGTDAVRAKIWRTPRFCSPASTASTRSSPATAISTSPGRSFRKGRQGMPGLDGAKGTVGGKPGVMGGFWGSHLGLIDLMLERDGNQWKVVGSTSRGAADLQARRRQDAGARSRARRMSRTPPRPSTRRRSPMCARRSARPRRRSIPISRWSPTTRRCRSSPRRRPGTSRTC